MNGEAEPLRPFPALTTKNNGRSFCREGCRRPASRMEQAA